MERKALSRDKLLKISEVPPGENLDEWMALTTFELYNQISMLYGIAEPFCTKNTCQCMSAGPTLEYQWLGKSIPAQEYFSKALGKMWEVFSNRKVFPMEEGEEFAQDIGNTLSSFFGEMLKLYAHMYHMHYKVFKLFELEEHLNTSFKHFTLFAVKYNLLERDEMFPLKKIVDKILDEEEL